MTSMVPASIERLREGARRLAIAETAATIAYWDERIAMPPSAAEWRAAQRSWLGAQVDREHRAVDLASLIAAAEREHPGDPEVRAMQRSFESTHSLMVAGRSAFEHATSTALAARRRALADGEDGAALRALGPVVELARLRARAHRPDLPAYDALLDLHEPGMTSDRFESLMEPVVSCARELVARPRRSPVRASGISLDDELDDDGIRAVESAALRLSGFDGASGHGTWSERAFCSVLGPHDVRVASRFGDSRMLRIVLSTLHEAGHAVYMQRQAAAGLPPTLLGIASVGIDEAQSRLFENHIGCSTGFWQHVAAALGRIGIDADGVALAGQARHVAPSARRLGSDEASYLLHIDLRFRIERDIVGGSLEFSDIPSRWTEELRSQLGVEAADLRDGPLQDVHWWLGQLGYFPCYALGDVYGAQLVACAGVDDGEVDDALRAGRVAPWLEWLDGHVWARGRSLTGVELVESLAGSIDAAPLVRRLERLIASS